MGEEAGIEQAAQAAVQSGEATSAAAQIILSVVPLVGIVFGATLLFFFLLWNYKLRKELIRTGLYQPVNIHSLRLLTLLAGITTLAVGIPMTIVFAAIEGISYTILGGLIPACIGTGLIAFYAISRRSD